MNINEFSPYIRVAMFSVLTPPFKISKRVIYDYEIILVTNGKCKITVDSTAYFCKKNDVVFLRPGVPHEFESVDNCDFFQPHIHFDVSYDGKSNMRSVSFKPKEKMSQDELNLIQDDVFKDIFIPCVFSPQHPDQIKKIFFDIIEIFQKKSYNYELLYKAKMLELIHCILTQFDSNKGTKSDVILNPVIAAKEYIDSNYLSNITLDGLSKQFYINKYTLMRKFKVMYKQNIIEYYRNKRIEYVKNALMTTTLSITCLSEKLNFYDIYSFSRFFKTYAGCAPTQYRKKLSAQKKD